MLDDTIRNLTGAFRAFGQTVAQVYAAIAPAFSIFLVIPTHGIASSVQAEIRAARYAQIYPGKLLIWEDGSDA